MGTGPGGIIATIIAERMTLVQTLGGAPEQTSPGGSSVDPLQTPFQRLTGYEPGWLLRFVAVEALPEATEPVSHLDPASPQ